MAFNRENLTIIANNAKAGVVPSLWLYWNEASDTVTTSGFFTDKRLNVGDQIEVLVAAFTSSIRYRVSAITDGAATVTATSVSSLTLGGVQTLTGAGAVDVTNETTLLVTTGANALTLAAGTFEGQRKVVKMKTDGGDGTLTVTNFKDGTTITFNDINDVVELIYADAKWQLISNSGATVA